MARSYADIARELLRNEGMDGGIYGGDDSDLGEAFGADEDPSIEGFLSDVIKETGGFEDANLNGSKDVASESDVESDDSDAESPFVIGKGHESDATEDYDSDVESTTGSVVIPDAEETGGFEETQSPGIMGGHGRVYAKLTPAKINVGVSKVVSENSNISVHGEAGANGVTIGFNKPITTPLADGYPNANISGHLSTETGWGTNIDKSTTLLGGEDFGFSEFVTEDSAEGVSAGINQMVDSIYM